MNSLSEQLEHLQVISAISALPDDASISSEIAALFLNTTPKTLARLRQSKTGSGPRYTQYPDADSKARNQPVSYIMRELRAWRESHIVSSTMDAAVKRGMTFSRVDDLAMQQPFWSSGSEIINHAYFVTIEEFSSYLNDPAAELIWVTWPKILSRKWKSGSAREPFHLAYVNQLLKLIEAAKQLN